ncbi:MAG TPA: asparaginase domain-containing protein, partial [Bacillales bacterium]|nr:asparaginase domain-containing protein [Bacillales bacterium]
MEVITTGGTIASLRKENGDVIAALNGKELVQKLGITDHVQVTTSATIGSFGFEMKTLRKVALDVIKALKSEDVSGVVVTHGTDTMEETAFYLSMVTSLIKKPLALTGAQINASSENGDGPINLRDSIRFAQSEQASELGAVIVFGGFIYLARDVRKVDTSALEAFQSPGYGPVGRVDEGEVSISRFGNTRPVLPPLEPIPVSLIRLGIG